MTPEKAQGMKVLLYRKLKNKYGEMKDYAAEGKKALAKGLRIELERLHPRLKNLNEEHKTLRSLEKQIERAAARISNREILSLLASTSAAAGGAAAHGPEGLMYGLAVQLMVSPRSKTAMSIALNRALQASKTTTTARRLITPSLVTDNDQ